VQISQLLDLVPAVGALLSKQGRDLAGLGLGRERADLARLALEVLSARLVVAADRVSQPDVVRLRGRPPVVGRRNLRRGLLRTTTAPGRQRRNQQHQRGDPSHSVKLPAGEKKNPAPGFLPFAGSWIEAERLMGFETHDLVLCTASGLQLLPSAAVGCVLPRFSHGMHRHGDSNPRPSEWKAAPHREILGGRCRRRGWNGSASPLRPSIGETWTPC